MTKSLRDGCIAGGATAMAVAAVVAASPASPGQQMAIGLSVAWVAHAGWAQIRPAASAADGVIVAACIATCAGVAARAAEAVRDRIAVRAREAARTAQRQRDHA